MASGYTQHSFQEMSKEGVSKFLAHVLIMPNSFHKIWRLPSHSALTKFTTDSMQPLNHITCPIYIKDIPQPDEEIDVSRHQKSYITHITRRAATMLCMLHTHSTISHHLQPLTQKPSIPQTDRDPTLNLPLAPYQLTKHPPRNPNKIP